MRIKPIAIVSLASLAFAGCATITSNEMQTLSLNTKTTDGQTVEQAKCVLKNDKGRWETSSPGFVSVHRSADDLMVECNKEGLSNGYLRAISRASGNMFGNIIIGGGVGAIIDHADGKGYNYPDELPVKMAASVTVDRKQQNATQSKASNNNRSKPFDY
jgi:hypothetical protein